MTIKRKYKIGDKFVCIKTDFINLNNEKSEISDKVVGEIYTISNSDRVFKGHIVFDNYLYWLEYNSDHCIMRVFEDHFVSLAEWREKQIDSILNDLYN